MNILKSIRDLFGVAEDTQVVIHDEDGNVLTEEQLLDRRVEALTETIAKGEASLMELVAKFDQVNYEFELKIQACDVLLQKGVSPEVNLNKQVLQEKQGKCLDKFLRDSVEIKRKLDQQAMELFELEKADDFTLEEAIDWVTKASDEQQAKVKKVMDEWKQGGLKSSSGDQVTDQKQAIAIALSEAGLSKRKKKSQKKSEDLDLEKGGPGSGRHKKGEFKHDYADSTYHVKSNLTGAQWKEYVKHRRSGLHPKQAVDKVFKSEITDLEKAGEGSRGGTVIGHTRSGKPLYMSLAKHAHADFNSEDHEDAAQFHDKKVGELNHKIDNERTSSRNITNESRLQNIGELKQRRTFHERLFTHHLNASQNEEKAEDLELDKAEDYTGHYANVIVTDRDGRILFLKRADDKSFEPGKYCLPGGHIDEGETVNQAAARELKEEANLEVDSDKLFTLGKIECQDGKWAFYLKTTSSEDQGVVATLDDESAGACWMTKDEWLAADLIYDLKDHLLALFEPKVQEIKAEELELIKAKRKAKHSGHTSEQLMQHAQATSDVHLRKVARNKELHVSLRDAARHELGTREKGNKSDKINELLTQIENKSKKEKLGVKDLIKQLREHLEPEEREKVKTKNVLEKVK